MAVKKKTQEQDMVAQAVNSNGSLGTPTPTEPVLEDTAVSRPKKGARTVKIKEEPTAEAGRIGLEEIQKARQTLDEYKRGKANLEARIIDNEQWWKMRHWEQIRKGEAPKEVEPTSAWLFNSVANKHAAAMDNYPEPCILPREIGDVDDARMLDNIVPVVLEQNQYERVYSDVWWYKLIAGTGVKGVFWDPNKSGGLGDISIEKVSLLNLFWEPGITDIQKSRNFFHIQLMDNDVLSSQYPQLKDKLGGETGEVSHYLYDDAVDTSEKSAVVDWYYKVMNGGKALLHYVKFVGDTLLYASENDPEYQDRGFYDHGLYPFAFDPLYVVEGSPAGFGCVDVMKDTQMYIDKLGQATMKTALMTSKKRYFVREDGGVNETEFADWDKDIIHVYGGLGEESIRELKPNPLSSINVQMMQLKIDELKETSGNRDFTQGGTAGGVTAASAIAALQESGSKLDRDMLKASYRAFVQECYLIVELIRQFYDEPRQFRITGEMGEEEFVTFDNSRIRPHATGETTGDDEEMLMTMPIFDIKVRAQRANAFSRLSQNEMAKEFFGMGFFNPQFSDQALACMEMMDFEGKDMVMQRIQGNGTMYQQLQQMQMQMAQMAAMLQSLGLPMSVGGGVGQPVPDSAVSGEDSLGRAVNGAAHTDGTTAVARAMGRTEVPG